MDGGAGFRAPPPAERSGPPAVHTPEPVRRQIVPGTSSTSCSCPPISTVDASGVVTANHATAATRSAVHALPPFEVDATLSMPLTHAVEAFTAETPKTTPMPVDWGVHVSVKIRQVGRISGCVGQAS
jgi:hypothetical protein